MLHIAIRENNKAVAYFLINCFKEHSKKILKELLMAAGECTAETGQGYELIFTGTALHLACIEDDVEIVRTLLDAAAEILNSSQEFITCLNEAFFVAAKFSHNVQIFNELLSRGNNKMDLILRGKSALFEACLNKI